MKTPKTSQVAQKFAGIWKDRRGQDFIEYALVSGLVASSAMAISPAVAATATRFSAVLGILDAALAQMARG